MAKVKERRTPEQVVAAVTDQSCDKSPMTGKHCPVMIGQHEVRHGWAIPMRCRHCGAEGSASVEIVWDQPTRPARGRK
jgi:hypothetical protein